MLVAIPRERLPKVIKSLDQFNGNVEMVKAFLSPMSTTSDLRLNLSAKVPGKTS